MNAEEKFLIEQQPAKPYRPTSSTSTVWVSISLIGLPAKLGMRRQDLAAYRSASMLR